MGELHPLGDNLPEECRAFAVELRRLFDGLGVSVRRYAVRRHRDPSTVSRFLSGTRIPPWEFVFDLFTDLAARRGAAVTPAAIELMRDLHRAAVRTSRSPAHAMEILQVQLADADRAARCSLAHQDALGEVLLDRKHRIADLEVRLNQAEAAWATERARADALERGLPDREELIKERDKLEREVRRLSEELAEVRRRGRLAEDRCLVLERQLAVVEAQRPAAVPRPDEEPGVTVGPMAPPGGGPRPKILVVDDQPNNLLAMEAVLATLDQELVTASSGQEALKALLDHDDFAVILLDVQMPEMDGYETAAHIKRRPRNRDIPIIFLTAMGADPEHSSRGYAAGAVDYMAKPFDPWALRAKVSVFTEIFLERRQRRSGERGPGE
ncbi:response regulator [Streptomyces coffeae]|uniref:Response regulator n=1 Tax=Streptomyces coffeae TaxID=621382 RepID=A0ABS1N8F2_9ACTN|nr:response regulator [Streptomyces coffeae]MBL1096225.1 response regulator [Streptomyces coffeae]